MGPGSAVRPWRRLSALAPACTQSNRRYQMQFANTTPGPSCRKAGSSCTSPANLAYIGVNGTMVPPSVRRHRDAGCDHGCLLFRRGGITQNHACRISELEFDAYSLKRSLPSVPWRRWSVRPVGREVMPQAPVPERIGAEAFVPHEGFASRDSDAERPFVPALSLRPSSLSPARDLLSPLPQGYGDFFLRKQNSG